MVRYKAIKIIGLLIIVLGFLSGIYVGLVFVQPIINTCNAFDAGTLTGTMIGIAVLKCLFGSTISGVIWVITAFMGSCLYRFGDNRM